MHLMKSLLLTGCVAAMLPLAAHANISQYPIKAALDSEVAKEQLGPEKFYFADQHSGKGFAAMREVNTSRRVKKERGDSEQQSCNKAFVAALAALQKQVSTYYAEAVINVQSNIKHNAYASTAEYQCEIGRAMVHVALKGTVVGKPGAGAAAPRAPVEERLKKLKDLRDKGLIDEKTYKAREAEILKDV